jgi:CspA family cold shock protein
VLSERAFSIDVTELLLTAAPTLTGAEVVSIRKALCDLARSHRWID